MSRSLDLQMSGLVAVYGTLRKNNGNHRRLETAEFVGTTTIKGTMKSLGGFPGITLLGDRDIFCEVYKVNEEQLASTDQLEGHPSFYQRVLTSTPLGNVWVYVLPDEQLADLPEITSGDWNQHVKEGYEARAVNWD